MDITPLILLFLTALVVMNIVLYHVWQSHRKKPAYYRRTPWWMILCLLLPTAAHAATILSTIESDPVFVGREYGAEDCQWIDTYQITKTTTYGDPQPTTVYTPGMQSYTGGQPGRFAHCPEDCDPTIVPGFALTRVEDTYSTFSETTYGTYALLTDKCDEDCNPVPTPEGGTFGLMLVGIGLVVVSRKVRKICA